MIGALCRFLGEAQFCIIGDVDIAVRRAADRDNNLVAIGGPHMPNAAGMDFQRNLAIS